MTTHRIKVMPPYFAALADGSKTFEVRRNDRSYQRGDILCLVEAEPGHCAQRQTLIRMVSYVYSGDPRFGGIEPGYVVLGLTDDFVAVGVMTEQRNDDEQFSAVMTEFANEEAGYEFEVNCDLGREVARLRAALAVVSMERDDARAELNETEAWRAFSVAALRSAEAERDDARDERDHYERQGSDTLAEWDKMRVERDRLQAELDALGQLRIEYFIEEGHVFDGPFDSPTYAEECNHHGGTLAKRVVYVSEIVPVEGDQT